MLKVGRKDWIEEAEASKKQTEKGESLWSGDFRTVVFDCLALAQS